MKAIEVVGTIDHNRRVVLDEPLPSHVTGRVRLLILTNDDEPSERAWLAAAGTSDAFAFLRDPAEDVYSLTDGTPFHDPR